MDRLKKIFFCFLYIKWLALVLKMLNCIHIISQLKRGRVSILWLRIKDIGRELDVKNVFDLVDKEIKGKFETNYPTEQQIRKYKRHGSELIYVCS